VGAIGSPPAVINAVVDALKDYGVRHLDMPATATKIWSIIQSAQPRMAAD
jgi:carbon-monoxide dehydrogenase large subunit